MSETKNRFEAPCTTLLYVGTEEQHAALIIAIKSVFGEKTQVVIEAEKKRIQIIVPWAVFDNGAGGTKICIPWVPRNGETAQVQLNIAGLIKVTSSHWGSNVFLPYDKTTD